jgi:hypothetical protein
MPPDGEQNVILEAVLMYLTTGQVWVRGKDPGLASAAVHPYRLPCFQSSTRAQTANATQDQHNEHPAQRVQKGHQRQRRPLRFHQKLLRDLDAGDAISLDRPVAIAAPFRLRLVPMHLNRRAVDIDGHRAQTLAAAFRFGQMFASEIRRKRVQRMRSRCRTGGGI